MLNNLSNVLMMVRRYDEAASLLREAIDVRSKLPADLKNPAGDLIQRSNLGRCLLYADRPIEALAILEPTRIESERLVGLDHTTTILILVSQAHALSDSGRAAEGVDVATEAVARAAKTYGADDDLTLRARSARVAAMSTAGRRGDAADEQAKIAAAMEAKYGPEHSDVLTNRRNLGKMLGDAGRYPEAIAVLDDAAKRTAAKYGDESVTAAIARNLLAQVYAECGRAAEAEPLLRASLATLSTGNASLEGTIGAHLATSSAVGMAVIAYGPSDILRMGIDAAQAGFNSAGWDAPNTAHAAFIGCGAQGMGAIRANLDNPAPPWPQCVAQANLANPVLQVDGSDPPTWIGHANDDPVVPWPQSQRLSDALQSAGVDSDFVRAPSGGHQLQEAQYALARSFVTQHFANSVPPLFADGFE